MKSFSTFLSYALLAVSIGIIIFGVYNLYMPRWTTQMPLLPWGPSAGISYIILGIGIFTLVMLRRFKKEDK